MPRRAALALAVLVLFAGSARADDEADRHTAALDLLHQMHTTDNMAQLASNLVQQVKQAATRGDPDLMKLFDTFAPHLQGEVEAARGVLVDRIIAVYTRAYTADEMKQMAAFYQTPLGQKIVATQVDISSQILQVTREWGTGLSRQLLTEARVNLQSAQ